MLLFGIFITLLFLYSFIRKQIQVIALEDYQFRLSELSDKLYLHGSTKEINPDSWEYEYLESIIKEMKKEAYFISIFSVVFTWLKTNEDEEFRSLKDRLDDVGQENEHVRKLSEDLIEATVRYIYAQDKLFFSLFSFWLNRVIETMFLYKKIKMWSTSIVVDSDINQHLNHA